MNLRLLSRRSRQGFTLIELLLVIGIIAILAAIVIVAINPTKQLGDARNAQRKSDVNTILNAIYQYAIDKNQIPTTILPCNGTNTGETVLCKGGHPFPSGCTNVNMLTGSYLVNIPVDPAGKFAAAGTGYTGYRACSTTISGQTTGGRIEVCADMGLTEVSSTKICVKR